MADFGLVGAAYTAQSITQDDQELINWYVEVDPTKNPGKAEDSAPGDRGIKALYPTPGTVVVANPRVGPWRGMRNVNGVLYGVVGNTLYSYDGVFFSELGALGSSSGPVAITDNGASLYLTDGVYRYAYTISSGLFQTLTDGAFTSGDVCDVTHNYIVYNRPGTNEWGCTNASSVVSSGLNLGSKLVAPDPIVAMICDKGEVWLIGEVTSEVQTDVGSFPFPFQPLPGASLQHGCVAAFSVSRLGEGVCWLSRDTRGQNVVILVTGYAPQRISTHAVEFDISQGDVSDAIGYTYQQTGHEFYMLTFPTQNKTWCFDLATGLWHKRGYRVPDTGALMRHRSNCRSTYGNDVVVGDFENGNLYRFSTSVYTDDGEKILRRRRPPHITSDLNNVFHHSLQVQFQPGVGNSDIENPQMILRWSDDGGFTFGNDHFISVGKTGQYKNRAIKRALGCARDRVYEIDVTDPFNAVIVSGELKASAGAA